MPRPTPATPAGPRSTGTATSSVCSSEAAARTSTSRCPSGSPARSCGRARRRPRLSLSCVQRSPPKVGAEALGPHDYASWALFCWSETRRNQDEVQARVHLARRLRARSEPTQQDEDRRLRLGADDGAAAAVELRRQLHPPGRRL